MQQTVCPVVIVVMALSVEWLGRHADCSEPNVTHNWDFHDQSVKAVVVMVMQVVRDVSDRVKRFLCFTCVSVQMCVSHYMLLCVVMSDTPLPSAGLQVL